MVIFLKVYLKAAGFTFQFLNMQCLET